MSNTVNFGELDRQHVELLPARTVLSMFSAQVPEGPTPGGDLSALVTQVTGIGGTSSGEGGSNTDGDSGAESD